MLDVFRTSGCRAAATGAGGGGGGGAYGSRLGGGTLIGGRTIAGDGLELISLWPLSLSRFRTGLRGWYG